MAPPRNPGMVCGTLLNYRADLEALGPRLASPPYEAPPRAPVLYLKPRNTWIRPGEELLLPAGRSEIAVGASLGLVIGQTATRVTQATAAEYVAALCVVNDACLPHSEVFRPAIKERCRDRSFPIGPDVRVDSKAVAAVRSLRTYINGELRAEWQTRDCIRGASRLLADVSAFMTLSAGDILFLGTPRDMPLARAGDRVTVDIEGLGDFENPIVAEVAP